MTYFPKSLLQISEDIERLNRALENARRLLTWAYPVLCDCLGDQEYPRKSDQDMLAEVSEWLYE